jgi:hypothetical protein
MAGKNTEAYSSRLQTGSRTYFFDIERGASGDLRLGIMESRATFGIDVHSVWRYADARDFSTKLTKDFCTKVERRAVCACSRTLGRSQDRCRRRKRGGAFERDRVMVFQEDVSRFVDELLKAVSAMPEVRAMPEPYQRQQARYDVIRQTPLGPTSLGLRMKTSGCWRNSSRAARFPRWQRTTVANPTQSVRAFNDWEDDPVFAA